ncbi:maleylpyruvate isomerase family mycothiol-dependent enzyme [Streptomyces aidingensis]|uniref:TIGR03083 family protein n=1 Tax=Streptomyces aidingensis TaxID=910347 RepID=A0A1I1FR83_9ACTN|nr:maleylpyruvate isomerase family mycothiol-dependent enzyme [Streptomyces aidingensis]SFC01781.1 TIGR03083 family protein [Streptomyces aidingensis]
MDSAAYLGHLRRELDAFRACLAGGELSAPVETCGEWTLLDLAGHLGGQNLWVATAVTERRGDYRAGPPPRERAALLAWYDTTCAAMLEALSGDPAAEAWTFHPPHTIGFWQRRRALETLIHRWDAEHALGGPAGPPDPALAADGVAEVFEIMAPRQIVRGRAAEPVRALRVAATDTDGSWTYGPGEPVATVSGPAGDLLLLLWGRLPHTAPSLTWHGDPESGRQLLNAPLVP